MNNTFKQFQKLKIPLIMEINKVMDNKQECLRPESENKLRDYKFCVVGSIRERLGLSNQYEFGNDKDHCSKCVELGKEMPDPIFRYQDLKDYINYDGIDFYSKFKHEQEMTESKQKYEGLLLEFKQHLLLDHNIKLNGD